MGPGPSFLLVSTNQIISQANTVISGVQLACINNKTIKIMEPTWSGNEIKNGSQSGALLGSFYIVNAKEQRDLLMSFLHQPIGLIGVHKQQRAAQICWVPCELHKSVQAKVIQALFVISSDVSPYKKHVQGESDNEGNRPTLERG